MSCHPCKSSKQFCQNEFQTIDQQQGDHSSRSDYLIPCSHNETKVSCQPHCFAYLMWLYIPQEQSSRGKQEHTQSSSSACQVLPSIDNGEKGAVFRQRPKVSRVQELLTSSWYDLFCVFLLTTSFESTRALLTYHDKLFNLVPLVLKGTFSHR
jgi:hypothetical protein